MDPTGRHPQNRRTPAEIRREHERRRGAGHTVVDRILGRYHDEFRRRVAVHARRYGIDPAEVYQSACERLLRQSTVDPDHEGLLGWVDNCIRYAALDLLKAARRVPEPRAELPDVPDERWHVAEPGDREWVADLLRSADVTDHQFRLLLLLAEDPATAARELAAALGVKEPYARKVKERAMRKLRTHIGLGSRELNAYLAWHQGRPCTDEDALEKARWKVARFLDGPPPD
ncbi:hypothetical protein GCM10022243_18630 [Saccharothrix violaceirubra]|uniref:DNA-directed RNA polymerase specialized sigma24 family protein n=1 Tax=Saccharothrix violaceirubra TaxID=413306 RepID=A0A7W7T277_9PSEU|nr:hypothetical protein [Saccharothrix violaceirubra]MBB4965230.1 DNA-directed RNA polymerase specialized sigma24 family protein [Saccharothrix violaceirubra]